MKLRLWLVLVGVGLVSCAQQRTADQVLLSNRMTYPIIDSLNIENAALRDSLARCEKAKVTIPTPKARTRVVKTMPTVAAMTRSVSSRSVSRSRADDIPAIAAPVSTPVTYQPVQPAAADDQPPTVVASDEEQSRVPNDANPVIVRYDPSRDLNWVAMYLPHIDWSGSQPRNYGIYLGGYHPRARLEVENPKGQPWPGQKHVYVFWVQPTRKSGDHPHRVYLAAIDLDNRNHKGWPLHRVNSRYYSREEGGYLLPLHREMPIY